MIVEALKRSGHTVVLLDQTLRIRWVSGLRRSVIGAPVQILWRGAGAARREIKRVLESLAAGNGCSAEYRRSRGKSRGIFRLRIDFIPLCDPTGEVEGFAAIQQIAHSAASELSDGVAEIYELLFELHSDEFSHLLKA
ncbi:MAG: hypothetical protein EBZ78_09260 [Verrucomicrobia bacterium]|nr:hypothetical protein [Verrucomicrobiota bacterium]